MKNSEVAELFSELSMIGLIVVCAIENFVCSGGELYGIGVLTGKRLDVSHSLVVGKLVDRYKKTGLLNVTEALVHCCSKDFHCG